MILRGGAEREKEVTSEGVVVARKVSMEDNGLNSKPEAVALAKAKVSALAL